jgi:hypothetical protein
MTPEQPVCYHPYEQGLARPQDRYPLHPNLILNLTQPLRPSFHHQPPAAQHGVIMVLYPQLLQRMSNRRLPLLPLLLLLLLRPLLLPLRLLLLPLRLPLLPLQLPLLPLRLPLLHFLLLLPLRLSSALAASSTALSSSAALAASSAALADFSRSFCCLAYRLACHPDFSFLLFLDMPSPIKLIEQKPK